MSQSHDGFNLLNGRFFRRWNFHKIPKNTVLERPIHWIFLAADNARFMVNPYHQIHCGENSKVQIIKEYQSLDNSELYVNSHCSTFLDQGAHLEFTMIQNETVNGFHHLNNHIVYQNRDSQFKQTAVSLAGRLLRNQVFVRLQEPGSKLRHSRLVLWKRRRPCGQSHNGQTPFARLRKPSKL